MASVWHDSGNKPLNWISIIPLKLKAKLRTYEKWLMSSILVLLCDMIYEPMIWGDVDTYVPV